MSAQTNNNPQSNNTIQAKEQDAIIALEFIITDLRKYNIHILPDLLSDVIQIHLNTTNYAKSINNFNIDDFQDILCMHIAKKYYHKVKIDQYRDRLKEYLLSH
ncbi:MAG: hypothetical protein ACI9CD_000779 [Candidatus Deianiraeaceae bacterium]|jgi:hypothetical protein